MKNLHFGAGNIGRGFIGELLHKSGYHITFVDINKDVVNDLKNRDSYTIKVLDNDIEEIVIKNFDAINIATEKELLTKTINEVDLITTSIGPNVLQIIAKDIANGLKEKVKTNNTNILDIVACENMIEGTSFLQKEIYKHLTKDEQEFIEKYVGFPNSAVDRIVPAQKHSDYLLVEVEKFCEWVIEKDKLKVEKNKTIENVTYVTDLAPFIERKLFTVNTGHAALSYVANYKGLKYVSDGASNEEVREHFIKVLEETGELLIKKWHFKEEDIKNYHKKTISRFENKLIIDEVARICRTPIRKLGYNERFIKPIRECLKFGLSYENLSKTCAYILKFKDENDEQAVKLQQLLTKNTVKNVIKEVTNFENDKVANEIENYFKKL